eukprot:g567.t1
MEHHPFLPDLRLPPTATAVPDPAAVAAQLENQGDEMDLSGDGGVIKTLTSKGTASKGTFPAAGDCVVLQYVAYHGEDGTLFDSSRTKMDTGFKFILGDRGKNALMGQGIRRPIALDMLVATMTVGECAVVRAEAPYAFGDHGLHHPNRKGFVVPPNEVVRYNVELTSIEKDPANMEDAELLELGGRMREAGNKLFAEGRMDRACERYSEALRHLQRVRGSKDDKLARRMMVQCLSNQAQCELNRQNWNEAAALCDKALTVYDDGAVDDSALAAKTLFRRAKVRQHEGKLDEAVADLTRSARLNPESRAVRSLRAKLKAQAIGEKTAQRFIFEEAMRRGAGGIYSDMKNVPPEPPSVFQQFFVQPLRSLCRCCSDAKEEKEE